MQGKTFETVGLRRLVQMHMDAKMQTDPVSRTACIFGSHESIFVIQRLFSAINFVLFSIISRARS